MEKLGEGYFYDVFDLGNEKVLKKKKSFRRIGNSLGNKINPFLKWFRAYFFISKSQAVTEKIKDKMKSFPELSRLLGDPKFNTSTDFEQDKVILLMDYFATHTLEENKSIIDKYIDLLQKMLTYGIHDYVYKFKNGYGVSKNGEIVFIDFNEVTFSKEKTLDLAEANHWQKEAQYRKYEEGELKQYLGKRFRETLTKENIENLWGKRI